MSQADARKAQLGLIYDTDDWEKTPFIIALPDPEKGQVFKSYEEILAYTCDPEKRGSDNPRATNSIRQIVQSLTDKKYLRLNPRNTSLGGNEALNCYPQFTEDDDIRYLATAAEVIQANGQDPIILTGLGRVYSEVYDSNQKIMYITAGVAKYSRILDFYNSAVNEDMASLIHGTEAASSKVAEAVGKAIGNTIMLPLNVMMLPIRYLKRVGEMMQTDKVTKYYDFWSDMLLYYKHVNDILIHLSVNLGLYEGADPERGTTGVSGGSVQQVQQTIDAAQREAYAAGDARSAAWEVPYFLQHGIDMFKIASRRETLAGAARDRWDASHLSNGTQEAWSMRAGKPSQDGDTDIFSPYSSFIGSLARATWNAATSGDRFFGIRVEKSTDSSESFSNSTGESSIAQTINSAAASARDTLFSTGLKADGGTGGGGMVGAALGAATSIGSGAKSAIGGAIEGIASTLVGSGTVAFAKNTIAGNAYVDIPKIWTGSQFSKSYSFRMQLRDPHGGNPISFMYNIGVPLACMLALVLPRSAGANSYGQPFFIRAYCKGMFAVPLGMITNMTVTRGAPEHGWSIYGLPTVVEISFDLEDMATVMHMALNAPSLLPQIFEANSPFQEYLLTLSAVGMKERLLIMPQLRRRMQMWRETLGKNTILNPNFLGMWLGNTGPVQVYGAISKFSSLPD